MDCDLEFFIFFFCRELRIGLFHLKAFSLQSSSPFFDRVEAVSMEIWYLNDIFEVDHLKSTDSALFATSFFKYFRLF